MHCKEVGDWWAFLGYAWGIVSSNVESEQEKVISCLIFATGGRERRKTEVIDVSDAVCVVCIGSSWVAGALSTCKAGVL